VANFEHHFGLNKRLLFTNLFRIRFRIRIQNVYFGSGSGQKFRILCDQDLVMDPDPQHCYQPLILAQHAVLRIRIRIRKDQKLLPSRIQSRIRNKLISRIGIRIIICHWGSCLLKDKCSNKNTFFHIKSSISAQKLPSNVDSDSKCENFTKISKTRIWIRIRNNPPGRIRIRN